MLMRSIVLVVCLTASMMAAVEEKGKVEKTFTVAQPQSARLEVDNIWGSIRVTGHDSREVQIVAHETITGDTKDRIALARKEVKLDLKQEGDTVRAYVDGPFRCNCRDGERGSRGSRDSGYEVKYDFEIRAPRQASVWLRTVNDGEIVVSGIAGDYDVKNINGGVEVQDAAGSGNVYALNGGVKVTFRENPRANSSFGSLNGDVELFFRPNLSADLRMKTFNGGIYSDFPVTATPLKSAGAEKRGNKFVYRSNRFTGARVGNGGPEIKLDGFNGDIRILERK